MSREPIVLYLDTNHVSHLARHPGSATSAELLRLLNSSTATVALSIIHLLELANPTFKSAGLVASLLDRLPVVWALSLDDLWKAEVRDAFARFSGGRAPVRPFGSDVSTALGGPVSGARPSEVLRAFASPELRQEMGPIVARGLIFDQQKIDATLVREPLKLLKKAISEYQPKQTETGLVLPRPAHPDLVLAAVGGLRGFPSYSLMHAVASARLRDRQFRARPSDVLDLSHVGYAAYANITALDRSYAARVRAARPDLGSRVTHRLSEVVSALAAGAV